MAGAVVMMSGWAGSPAVGTGSPRPLDTPRRGLSQDLAEKDPEEQKLIRPGELGQRDLRCRCCL